MGDVYTNPPQSRNEAILESIINGTSYTDPPQSRIEDLLLQLKAAIEGGGGGGGTTVIANPTGEATSELGKLQVGTVIYSVLTNAVNTLTNYYLKSETYTQAEVNALIAAITTLNIEVVQQLPTTDISRTTIYLIPKSTAQTSNVYDEYINTTGTSAGWELIGDTQIDLSDYVTDSDLSTALQNYVTSTGLVSILADYATKSAAYLTDDKSETTLDDADYVPFYDTSANAKRKTLWSNIKSVLKTYFDTFYNKITKLSELTGDVNIVEPKIGNVLIYNGTKWINKSSVPVVYGFHVDSSESDPAAAVTYLEQAVGMTPAAMDFVADKFNYGSWENAFFMPRPCMLKADGIVDYYLDENDYSKKEDGTASDIANTSYNGNAMMEWGKYGDKIWYKIVPDTDPTSYSVFISNEQMDEDYHAWSFINNQGDYVDHFYTPIYNGSLVSNKLRSLSGQQVHSGYTFTQQRTAAKANNPSTDVMWDVICFADYEIISLLLILMTKTLDSQSAFGKGLCVDGTEQLNNAFRTGVHNTKGMFYGTNNGAASTYTNAVKIFGMENYYGFQWQRINGFIGDNGTYKIKLTHGTQDGSTATDYNETGANYINAGAMVDGSSFYLKKLKAFSGGYLIPNVVEGSSSTYYCDVSTSNTVFTAQGAYGCASNNGDGVGAYTLSAGNTAADTRWLFGSRISCKPTL